MIGYIPYLLFLDFALHICDIYGIGSFQRLYSSLSKIWLKAQDNAEWNAPQHRRELTSRVSSDSMPRSMRCSLYTAAVRARRHYLSAPTSLVSFSCGTCGWRAAAARGSPSSSSGSSCDRWHVLMLLIN